MGQASCKAWVIPLAQTGPWWCQSRGKIDVRLTVECRVPIITDLQECSDLRQFIEGKKAGPCPWRSVCMYSINFYEALKCYLLVTTQPSHQQLKGVVAGFLMGRSKTRR